MTPSTDYQTARAPEEQLLLDCARTVVGDTAISPEAVDADIDWEALLTLSNRHGTNPLVYRALAEHCTAPSEQPIASSEQETSEQETSERDTELVPAWVLDELRGVANDTSRRNLRYMNELLGVLTMLAEEDIRAVPYRGPVLAKQAYGDVALRRFGDLDLLVERDEIPRIRSLLKDRGYAPRYWQQSTERLSTAQQRAYTRYCRDYPFFNEEKGVEIELHWRVVSVHFPTSLTLDSFWDRTERAEIAGREIPVLSVEDRVLMICVHGSRHHWERLEWLVDLAAVQHQSEIDWAAVARRARRHNCRRMVALGPLLTHELFDIPIPDPVEGLLREDAGMDDIYGTTVEQLFDPDFPQNFATQRIQSRMMERRRDRARFWWRWLTTPDRPDIERLALPSSVSYCYPLVRMLRLCYLAVARVSGRRTAPGSDPDLR
ncbi:nucleotidyltransferase family protein [Haloarcula sp. S1CR25-12]|uniref:Nucleotidyltransferase family protein n=1 Tax=Haloarcula saliterrae TaxID=2950534 RepID=A0ABU2FIB9_9EURY|nr:nucleotidyltransferase family protein [Haloarcula sp. S1CR25-12]MDS0261455.1 nucleotidyltransferase family protein [Haloarcula sp. S1CR25-12]